MSYILISPLKILQTKTKYFTLGLNQYRNTHFRTLNTIKKRYKELMAPQILNLPVMDKVIMHYSLFPATKHLCDLDNKCSIIAKMVQDAIVELGKLPDDNYLHVIGVTMELGNIDKDNPRCEIKIKEVI